jgi:hypothetical protein
MYFKKWLTKENKVERIATILEMCSISAETLLKSFNDGKLNESLLDTLRKRFIPQKKDAPATKSAIEVALERSKKWLKDKYPDDLYRLSIELGYLKHPPEVRGNWVKPFWVTGDPNKDFVNNPGWGSSDPENYGYLTKQQWSDFVNHRSPEVHKEIEKLGGKIPGSAPSSRNNSDQEKAKGAIATLRGVLKDPKFQPLLDQLDKEISLLNKPNYYHSMSTGEKSWYDKLGDNERQSFDTEMGRSGDQNIDHGSEWWNTAAARANKAAQQGYRDSDANWKWAAGFANRQRIRRGFNPEWEKQLQGESTSFKEWLKKRMLEYDNKTAVNVAGQVATTTDPKEIALRQAVGDMTSDLMKKNPKLVPGKTKSQMVANAVSMDPQVKKSSPETQQAVSNYFIQQK